MTYHSSSRIKISSWISHICLNNGWQMKVRPKSSTREHSCIEWPTWPFVEWVHGSGFYIEQYAILAHKD